MWLAGSVPWWVHVPGRNTTRAMSRVFRRVPAVGHQWGSMWPKLPLNGLTIATRHHLAPHRASSRPLNRPIHTTPTTHQFEAIGVLVDAAEKANEEMETEEPKKRPPRAPRDAGRRSRRHGPPKPPNPDPSQSSNNDNNKKNKKTDCRESIWRKRLRATLIKAAEAAVIMTSGLAMLGFAGLAYHRAYRVHTLHKMEDALDTWDPVLAMSSYHKKIGDDSDWVERPQQALLNKVVAGEVKGRYYVLLGEKGTGKSSMLLHAIERVQGQNVVVMDAHADTEIFRQRLGKALSFEFHEDYWGGLFSLRGPRENTFLDIERVFNVLEEVAVRRYEKLGRPLCLVINNAHLIREDEDGRKVLSLLQQKAEALSGSGIANVVFNSDDYWLYQRLTRAQTRMDPISVTDLNRPESLQVLRRLRKSMVGQDVSDELGNTIYYLVGGRPQHLAAVAGHQDMILACQRLIDREKQWFLNNCGLMGAEMDDDVMDSGKFAAAGMLLAREFVRLEREETDHLVNLDDGTRELARIPLWRARQIMTRPDFIREYDNLNLFTLDAFSRVKPDSVVMMHAFREIVNLPGFNELLQATIDRIEDIEGLQRTRELTFKDLGGGTGREKGLFVLKNSKLGLEMPSEESEEVGEDLMMLDTPGRHYWRERIKNIDVGK